MKCWPRSKIRHRHDEGGQTRTNPVIDRELKNLGRTAVPVNALYLPGKKPVVTRELLSPSYLLEFLETEMKR